MKSKRWLRRSWPVVVLPILILFAGCGAEGGGGQAGQETPPSAQNPVTLTVWDWDYFPTGLKPYLSKVDQQFEKQNPGVTVDHVGIAYESASEKYHAAVASRQGPDVVTMYPGAYTAPFQQGLEPIESRISRQQRKEWEWLQDSVSPDGHTYVVPFATDGYVLAYNKALFKRAGVKAPRSWDEWLSSCEKLSAAGIVPQSGGWKDGEHFADYYDVISDSLLTEAEKMKLFAAELPLDGPKFERALELFLELQEHNCFSKNAAALSVGEVISNFASGRAASVVAPLAFGPLAKGGIYAKNLGEANLGVTPVPLPPGTPFKRFMSSGPRSGWAITNWSEHQDLAWKYISYVMRRQSFELGWKTVGLLPNVNSFEPTSPEYRPAREYLPWLRWPDNNATFTAYPGDVDEVLNRNASLFTTGALEASELLAQMQEQEEIDKER